MKVNEDPDNALNDSSAAEAQGGLLTRRRALLIACGGLTGLTVAGIATRDKQRAWLADMGLGDLAEVQHELQEHRAEFLSAYSAEGELPGGPAGANDLFVESEWVQYLRHESGQEVLPFERYRDQYHQPFMDGVRIEFERLQNKEERLDGASSYSHKYGSSTVSALANLKLAIDSQLGEDSHYWAQRNLIIDPVLHGDRQCRSGTRLFTVAALEHIASELSEGERLVEVHTNQHVQPGMLTADNRLITIEMTKGGRALRDYGQLDDLTVPIQVVDAAHSLAQSALDKTMHPDQTVIFDNIPPVERVGLPDFGVPAMRATTDQYGWGNGTVQIPSERLPIGHMDYVPAVTGTENDIYDSIQNSPETTDLLASLSPAEQTIVRDYTQHLAYVDRVWSEHTDIINPVLRNPGGYSEQQIIDKVQAVRDLLDEFSRYRTSNNLDQRCERAEQALRQHNLSLSVKDPERIDAAIRNNTTVMAERWGRGR